MINYTTRLDEAIRVAAWAHEQAEQHRKGTDIPYIIHPIGVMMIASNATEDEDTLIACLMHDVLEDVPNNIYNEADMRRDFGKGVVAIVKDVTKDSSQTDWHKQSALYLQHLEHKASDTAVIVSASDKIHNAQSILADHLTHGDDIWNRFTTKSSKDQLWWYSSILDVITRRGAPEILCAQLAKHVAELQRRLN